MIAVDTALTYVFLIAAFILTTSYVQRGIQGNFFQTTKDLGRQFDPRDPYTRDRKKEKETPPPASSQHQAASAQMMDASLIGAVVPERGPFANNPTMVLWSQPTGHVPRESSLAANDPTSGGTETEKITIKETYEDLR